MNKQDLVNAIAEETGEKKTRIAKILESMSEIIQQQVADGDEVTLMGFGSFTTSVRKARTVYNPHSGKNMQSPRLVLAKFRAGKDFKKKLNPDLE